MRPMTPRRGASPACSMNSAASCRCCGKRPIRRRACCKAQWRVACMPRWCHLLSIISSRRWRLWPARLLKRFSARWCVRRPLERAFVNNGGDIALHLASGKHFTVGLMDRPDQQGLMQTMIVHADDPTRGVATSGRHGRSFSLGIADAVTVLARTASRADAAATIIANAVDLPGHTAIVRCPAHDLQPDSDLGARLVTRGVGKLSKSEIERRTRSRRGLRARVTCRGIDRRRCIASAWRDRRRDQAGDRNTLDRERRSTESQEKVRSMFDSNISAVREQGGKR